MVDSTSEFLKKKFLEYYKNNKVELPDRFGRREYACVLFDSKGMIRHLSFDKRRDFQTFLEEKVPQHIYYSSAYYEVPNAPTMQEKNWMGAELIFDLDSDHIAKKMEYTEALEKVKEEFIKLIEEFLVQDFGFEEKYLEIYFSGARGYHCHVKDPAVFDLDSYERGELVDYITGRGLRDSLIFHDFVTKKRKYGKKYYAAGKSLKMPSPSEKGWKGRISRGVIEIVSEIKRSENPVERLQEYGVKKREAEKLARELSEERVKRIKEGMLDQSSTIRKFFLNSALRKTAVALSAGETDEPVTCDVKRLIRLPSSLHGKTGLKVVKIDINRLEDFNPLRDAVVFGEEPIKVEVDKPLTIEMKEEKFNIKKGENEVPSYVAVFLVGGGKARVLNKSYCL
jgi:DNA primase small subunit